MFVESVFEILYCISYIFVHAICNSRGIMLMRSVLTGFSVLIALCQTKLSWLNNKINIDRIIILNTIRFRWIFLRMFLRLR